MAELKSKSRSGFTAQKRLTLGETIRLAESAYRHAVWVDVDEQETAEQFADSVLIGFEALLADHAEIAGYAIRREGFGTLVAEDAAKVPGGWRPGWNWPGRPRAGCGGVSGS